ncbi:uncharacterized protein LOC125659653 [Ostrea edulis]|uniref:uncharacterized protein LOC125659653 n=1 Tax=Ostrea edulis TaxID=37623 RepID=UPI0024AFEFBC|nr:uncharacterized protein LOC125659653 [Ostrea edulis]
MSKRDIKFAQHYVECTQCEANAEYYCNTCTDNLCQVCRDRHTKSNATKSHVIVSYQEKQTTSPNTESCRIHPDFSYIMVCLECQLPVCPRCLKENHGGHTFKNTEDVLKETEQPCNQRIENIKRSIIPKWRKHLATLSEEKVTSKQTISNIRTQMREDAKAIKDLVDVILEKNFKKLDTDEKSLNDEFKNQASLISDYISNYEQLIDEYENEQQKPFEKLMLRKEILQSDIMELQLSKVDRPSYHRENVSENDVEKLLGKLAVPKRAAGESLTQPDKNPSVSKTPTSTTTSTTPIKCHEFTLPFPEARHISNVPNNKFWIGDEKGQIILKDSTGNKLDEVRTKSSSMTGYFSVTDRGDLLYIEKSESSIKMYRSDRSTATVTTTKWTPLCVFSSRRNGDILVGMTNGTSKKLVRYDREGQELWQSQYDVSGKPLYSYPVYITENVNGDACTSDRGTNDSVVVVDRDGNHRFSYRGHMQKAESKFTPYGICTDTMGRILVIINANSIHMIDKDGNFIAILMSLDKENGVYIEKGICIDNGNLWTCGENRVKMFKYLDTS